MRQTSLASLLVLVLILAFASTGAAEPPRGELVDGLMTRSDPAETYTLYLPSAYSREGSWPVVLVLDPRGRARPAAEGFRPGAERFGFVLLSSGSSRSDTLPGEDPNTPATNALFAEALTRYAVDPRRVYLAGFSGTSRFAWAVGYDPQGRVAGVIGVGGALPGSNERWDPMLKDMPFAFFGAAGVLDFNYREMHYLDEALDRAGAAHRVEFFAGGHAWAPPELLTQALGWMELQAMKSGRRPRSEPLVEELFAAGLEEAERLAAEGNFHAAWEGFRQLVDDFSDLRDVEAVRRQAERLGGLREVTEVAAQQSDARAKEFAHRQLLSDVLARLEPGRPLPSLRQLVDELGVRRTQRRAEGDTVAALSAQRQLEIGFVETIFYLPRRFLRAGDFTRAILTLRLASEIKPESWRPWIRLAEAYARSERPAKAVEALARAVALGYSSLGGIEGNPDFEAIRGEEGYRRIVESLR